MTARIPDNILDLAIPRLNSGEMIKTVAAELGYGRHALSRALFKRRSYVLPRVYRPANNAKQFDRDEMVQLYTEGESVLALSKRYSVGRKTISDHIERVGLQLRNASTANHIRMSRLSKQERLQLTQAAHNAVRGSTRAVEHKRTIAGTRQIRETHKGFCEDELSDALRRAGLDITPQLRFDFYNVDIVVGGRIAVEISTHPFSSIFAERPEKFIKLRERRIPLLYVHITSKKAGLLNMNKIIADVQFLHRFPPGLCQHRVVRCSVNRFARFRDDAGRLAAIPVPEYPTYTVISEETI